ncbi:MAG TPA: VCBS repeat-containing protein [Silvibacterium sp.]|nr:VCBS repeat-containing protein [Silvibacterium sp.]
MKRLSSPFVCLLLTLIAAPSTLSAQNPTFAAPKQISTSGLSFSGNFNGNGNTDLIIATDLIPGVGEFLTGDGTGNFSDTGPTNALPPFYEGLVADVNGDGKDDIITLLGGCESLPCPPPRQTNADGIITVMVSQGNGKFTQGYVGTLPAGLGIGGAVVGDFNKDGKADIAVLSYFNSYFATPAELCIFINQGNGTFTQTDYQLPADLGKRQQAFITNLVTGDFEGNGNQDIAFAFDLLPIDGFTSVVYPEILTFAGNGKGAFGPGVVSYTTDSFLDVSGTIGLLFAADLNHDGRTDLLAGLLAKPPNQASGNIRVPSLLAKVSGKFYWSSAVYLDISPEYSNILLDDFNGDGNPDLLTPLGIYLGLGNGAFKTPHIPLTFNGNVNTETITAIPLKTGDLPSLLVFNFTASPTLELLVNTTKK